MESLSNLPPNDRIAALEKALVEAERRNQKLVADLTRHKEQTAEQQAELRQLQRDYETLRVQKGGFGLKMLFANGLGGFLTGLVVCYALVWLTDRRPQQFERFRREQLFKVEYAISEGKFQEAAQILKNSAEDPENYPLHDEIEAFRGVVEAARRRCGVNGK